jgi:zinc transporter ZupT
MGAVEINNVFWVKIGFMVFVFLEALLSGYFPTWSKSCRESPKILGIANSFASGVFIAIALVHILPEEADNWAGLHPDAENLFPLPYFLMFCGYTLILIIDKVMFDTHALFDHDDHGPAHMTDPAEERLNAAIKRSFTQVHTASVHGGDLRKSMVEANVDIKQSVKEYLSPMDRFSVRLKASMRKSVNLAEPVEDQNVYFV